MEHDPSSTKYEKLYCIPCSITESDPQSYLPCPSNHSDVGLLVAAKLIYILYHSLFGRSNLHISNFYPLLLTAYDESCSCDILGVIARIHIGS